MLSLRALAASAAVSVLALSGCSDASSGGQGAYEREGDRAKGSADAPVTIIEYASVACGGCAVFHEAAMPTIYEYVDSGDVRLVFREMITGHPNLAIAGFMLANCAADDQYFDVVDILFEQQRTLMGAIQNGQASAQFQVIARSAGFSDEEFRACMTDEAGLQGVQDRSAQSSADGIGSTPSFIINGQLLEAATEDGAQVYQVGGQTLIDAQGPIPATFEGETFERIILYFKAEAEGADPAAPAETEDADATAPAQTEDGGAQ